MITWATKSAEMAHFLCILYLLLLIRAGEPYPILVPRTHLQQRPRVWYTLSDFFVVLTHQSHDIHRTCANGNLMRKPLCWASDNCVKLMCSSSPAVWVIYILPHTNILSYKLATLTSSVTTFACSREICTTNLVQISTLKILKCGAWGQIQATQVS